MCHIYSQTKVWKGVLTKYYLKKKRVENKLHGTPSSLFLHKTYLMCSRWKTRNNTKWREDITKAAKTKINEIRTTSFTKLLTHLAWSATACCITQFFFYIHYRVVEMFFFSVLIKMYLYIIKYTNNYNCWGGAKSCLKKCFFFFIIVSKSFKF